MKRDIRLAIPKPCHEKWGSFKPTQAGGFCSSCQKEVIDFTAWSEERLKRYFKNSHVSTCGRFKPEQLTTYTLDRHRAPAKGWFTVFLVSILLLLTSRQTFAQTTSTQQTTEQYEPEDRIGKVNVPRPAEIVVKGIVKADDGSYMPGVNIVRKGTRQGIVTNAEGQFSLRLENPAPSDILVFSFIGYKTVEYPVVENQSVQEFTLVWDTDNNELMGELVVAYPHWYNPRRWWWGIKSLF